MRIRLILIFILFSIAGNSQKYPHELPYYDFIKYDSNYIYHYNDGNSLSNFYQKIDSVVTFGEGQVNIMHYGGSHLQADIWSGQLRKNFQHVAPGMKAARGLVFPFDIAKTNNPSNYKTKFKGVWSRKRCATRKATGDWGLTGMQVTTYDTNANFHIFVHSRYYEHYDFNSVKIFYTQDSLSFQPIIENLDTNFTITYDSVAGFMQVDFDKYQDTFSVSFLKQDSIQNRFKLFGILFENDDPGIVYNAVGVNGADLTAYQKCNLIEEELPAIKPDLVIFSVGVNDAYTTRFNRNKYKTNYDSIINKFRSVYPEVSILFTTNNDTYYKKRYPNKNAYEVKRVMQELSEQYNCGIWDMFEVMGGLGSIDRWIELGLAKGDKIHFKGDGYRLIGDLMFSAMMKDYQQYLKERFNEIKE